MMQNNTSASAGRIARHAILHVLVSFPIACFSGALVTDIAYAATADMMWADFSAWLLAAGLGLGVATAIVWIVDVIMDPRSGRRHGWWIMGIGGLLVLVVALFDNLVHSRDAWTSVVPTGLTLSAITVVVMLATVWLGSAVLYRDTGRLPYSGAE